MSREPYLFQMRMAAGMLIRTYRREQQLTQEELSQLTGIPQPHISAMERGRRTIGKSVAIRLGEVLGCEYRQLL